MSSPTGLSVLFAACLLVGEAFAVPIDTRDDSSGSMSINGTTTSTTTSQSASSTSSTWLPDLYISPATTTAPSYAALYANADGTNLLISMASGSYPTPSLILAAGPSTTAAAPAVELPVATDPATSSVAPPTMPSTTSTSTSSATPQTSTVFSTIWVTASAASTVITSTLSPSTTSVAPTTAPTTTSTSPSSTSSSATSSAATTPSPSASPVIAAYYPDWSSDDLLPEQVDYNRFDWIDFAFAVPAVDFSLGFTQDNSADLLNRLVQLAHAANPPKRVKLSVGGWDGSKFFSDAVRTPENIAIFVKNIKAAVEMYGVDGIDIDWEYPGVQGAGSNDVSPSDTSNFLSFLQSLRTSLGPSALLTAAVSTSPFFLPSANSSASTAIFNAFGQVLDYILIMNYDVHDNTAPSPGSNAPLLSHGPACSSDTPTVSAELAIDHWTSAGFPAERILLGVPSYGYTDSSSATKLTERSIPSGHRKRAHWAEGLARRRKTIRRQEAAPSAMFAALTPGPVMPSSSGAPVPPMNMAASATPGTAMIQTDGSGQVQFNYLLQQGALVRSATPSPASSNLTAGPPSYFLGSGSYTRYWDECSSTPFLVSQSQHKVIPYDDPASLQLKAEYAVSRGIGGVNMFDIHGDTLQWDLTDALRAGLGLPQIAASTKP